MKKETHGGKRSGAGRPAMAEEVKYVQITSSLSPDLLNKINVHCSELKCSRNQFIRQTLKAAIDKDT